MKDESAGSGSEPVGTVSCQTSLSRRILVAEDEPSIRQILVNSLARAGYHVDTAADGALAWESLQVRNYDLLITDNIMPEISGIALVKKLRGKGSTLPVVMATGVVPEEELERHPSLGISNILLKPFTIEEILTTVKKVLSEAGSTETTPRRPNIIQATQK